LFMRQGCFIASGETDRAMEQGGFGRCDDRANGATRRSGIAARIRRKPRLFPYSHRCGGLVGGVAAVSSGERGRPPQEHARFSTAARE
jgi:hypothetical protein